MVIVLHAGLSQQKPGPTCAKTSTERISDVRHIMTCNSTTVLSGQVNFIP